MSKKRQSAQNHPSLQQEDSSINFEGTESNSEKKEQLKNVQSTHDDMDIKFRLASIQQQYLLKEIPFLLSAVENEIKSEQNWSETQPGFSSFVEFFSSNKKPDIQRWKPLYSKILMAQGCIQDGEIELGLRHYEYAYNQFTIYLREQGTYFRGNSEGLDSLHTGMEITRDIAFASSAAIAGVVAAPVAASAVFGSGVGTLGTIATGTVIGGTGVGVAQGGSNLLGQLIFVGDVDWGEVGQESWEGLKSGMISGGFAVLGEAQAVNSLFGLTPQKLATHCGGWLRQATIQATKQGAKGSTLGVLEEMTQTCIELATDKQLQSQWDQDPEGVLRDFRNRLLLRGATSFASGAVNGARYKPQSQAPLSSFVIKNQIKKHGVKALNSSSTIYKSVQSIVVDELPPKIASTLTEFILQKYLEDGDMDEKWLQQKILSVSLNSISGGFSGDVSSKAKKISFELRNM